MKNKIFILLIIASSVLIILGLTAFDRFFPKAPRICFPSVEEIVSASISFKNEERKIKTEDLKSLSLEIEKSSPTRKQSFNDFPDVRPYYTLTVQTSERYYCYYMYEDSGRIYIECPYEGIYLSDIRTIELISKYYAE